VFSSYRIFHFEDFTCVPPVSIDSGKTHQKSPAHSLVFRNFFCKFVWQIFQTGFTITSLHPTQFIILTCFADLSSSGPVSQTQKGVRGGIEYDVPQSVKNLRKIYKKILRIVIDYRCILPVLRKNHTCVLPVSNF
jgi:hypothetical protein